MEKNIILVRSTRELIDEGYVGYGWGAIDFSAYESSAELIKKGFKEQNIKIGRKGKQIATFHSIKEGDIIVVPVGGAMAVGIGTNIKEYEKNPKIIHSNNRIKVNFFKNDKEKVSYVPRSELGTDLERRLKIRMSIANLENFRTEIENIKTNLEEHKVYTWDSSILKKEENTKNNFIERLNIRFRSEKGLGISAGGHGLEKLIEEIFQAKGYDAYIPAKNDRPKGEDVDIFASKEGEFGSKGKVYLIQAKHHRGKTGIHGLNQLIRCKDGDKDKTKTYIKILITTAVVTKTLKDVAVSNKIIIVEGYQLAEWVYENLALLSQQTLRRLGISEVPTLI